MFYIELQPRKLKDKNDKYIGPLASVPHRGSLMQDMGHVSRENMWKFALYPCIPHVFACSVLDGLVLRWGIEPLDKCNESDE